MSSLPGIGGLPGVGGNMVPGMFNMDGSPAYDPYAQQQMALQQQQQLFLQQMPYPQITYQLNLQHFWEQAFTMQMQAAAAAEAAA